MSARTRIEQSLLRFDKLRKADIELGLDRMFVLLEKLGNPQDKLPPVVHVAGTNGKGSTIAMLGAMARADGRKVHIHTSPHLVCLNERYVIAGRQIGDQALTKLLAQVETANNGASVTQFELLTAAAFLAFAQTPADLVLLETGLGGELDATNVIGRPALCLLGTIAHDHADWLGDELSGIARAKAGIIKQGAKVFSSGQQDEVETVIRNSAAKLKVPVRFGGQDFQAYREHDALIWQDDTQLLDLPLPALPGDHQIENAGLAIAAATYLGMDISSIAKGLQNAIWPGRLQKIQKPAHWHQDSQCWIDGAHNPQAARRIAAYFAPLNASSEGGERPSFQMIFSQQSTKDTVNFLLAFKKFSPLVHIIPLTNAPWPQDPDELARIARSLGLQVMVHEKLVLAIRAVGNEPAQVLVTGSLYLAGEMLAFSESWKEPVTGANKNAR